MHRLSQTILIGFMLLSPLFVASQSNGNQEGKGVEGISDDPVFLRCLQQIPPFPEGQVTVVQEQISSCQKLLVKGLKVSNEHRLDFAIRQMKLLQSLGKNEALLKLVLDYKKLATQEDIPITLKNNYFFIAAQTQVLYGDIPNAVNTYTNLLNTAEENLDMTYIFHSLFDLGKLYEEQEDFSKAELYYQQAHNYVKYNRITNDLHANLLEAIVEMHLKAEQFSKARLFILEGLNFAQANDNKEYHLRFLLLKGKFALLIENFSRGKEAYVEALKFEDLLGNQTINKKYKEFMVEYYIANQQFDEAIVALEGLMLEEVSLKKTKEWSTRAHEIYLLNGNYQMAYENLLQSTVLEKHIKNDIKIKQSFYKRQKEEADKSFNADEMLAVQFSNEKRQNYFTYAFGFMSLVTTLLFYFLKEQKRNTNKQIEAQLEERTKELQLEITSLTESQKEATAFNEILTHDLRGPVRNIIDSSALARKEIPDNSNTSSHLRYVLKGSKQLRQLITDIGVFQEVSDKEPEPMELIDTNNLMKDLVESMDVLLEESGAEINFPELPSVLGRQTTLFSSFKHLIENGIKYNNSSTPIIGIQYFRNVDMHFFQIKDNGIGISSTYHEFIFELFKRLNGGEFCEGSGLGLNVSQKLLEKLGGAITVLESEEGKGSTFQISFPILEEPKVVESHVDINGNKQSESDGIYFTMH
ncbi:MAG: signal transduction histidine kinase [Polaribacter sp.]|jgi:signal transduction histidine kinase